MWHVGSCGYVGVCQCVCVRVIKPQCTSSAVLMVNQQYSWDSETSRFSGSLSDHSQWKISMPMNFHSVSKENQQIILKRYFRESASS